MTARKKITEAPPVEDLGESLQNRYRPKHLDDIRGQKEVVKSIRKALQLPTKPHVWLFVGPAGVGKTTIARILASGANCSASNIIEVDAASNTGVENMKEVMGSMRYMGFGDQPNRSFIIDECHMLSKAAWNSMLKTIEEPPPHVHIFLCTSEPGKIPETIISRCNDYVLKPVRYEDIMDLLEDVCDAERFDTPDEILSQVGRAANGSPRAALKMLSKVYDITDREEAARVLETPLDNEEVIELCRRMVGGKMQWRDVQDTIKGLGETNAESIRIVVVNYLNACIMGAKTDHQAARLCDMLHAFTRPTNPVDKLAPIWLAFSEFMLRD